jgi:signal transduction histidine kinase
VPARALQFARPVLIAIFAVVTTFLIALWVSHSHTREIHTRAQAIAERTQNEHSIANAREISRVRSEARDLALVLGAAGVIAAVGAGAAVFVVLRKRARLIDEHEALLAARANELEAFAGRVAHDLRNPLGAISLRIEALRLQSTTDPVVIDRLAANAARMGLLIEGLLTFARSGAACEPGARASLRTIIDQVVADARLQAERAGAELIVEDIPDVDVACAPGTLASVFSNLLDNAAKYITESKRARTITLRATARSGRVRVEVADTGPGIPPGTETAVFEPFRRVGSTAQPGLGLGLATVKRIVEAYGGRVGVSSVLGRGCTFWFELATASALSHEPAKVERLESVAS